MGWFKQHMIEVQEKGFEDINKEVCSKCVGDIALKSFIQEEGNHGKCDYCGKYGQVIAAEDLLGEVMDGIGYEYERAIDSMGYDGREGGYLGAKTYDHDEMIYIITNEAVIEKQELIDDINDSIFPETWCEKDPYGTRESFAYKSLWDMFCRQVKYSTRYVFFKLSGNQDEELKMEPYDILSYIAGLADDFDLIVDILPNTQFFRGRMHNDFEGHYSEKDLSAPPIEKAKANRMSAEGISIFYGAGDAETVFAEIINDESYATIVPFINTKPLKILDLTKIYTYTKPSLFDSAKRYLREPYRFFCSLNYDLQRPIDELPSIEYVPAQILTEYFRYVYTVDGRHLDGIKYASSKKQDGECYALFFDQSQCLSSSKDQMLKIVESEKKLYNNDFCLLFKK